MDLLLINPNTTASMTAKAEAAARRVARPDTRLIATNSRSGPPSIEGFHDVAMCLPGLLEEARRHPAADAIIIACFDDTGLDAMRCQVDVPVIVRLAGTNVEEGQKILAKSGLPIIRANTLMEAAERAVGAWQNDLTQATRMRAIK